MANEEPDLVVLGSGPGGYAAAFRAADLGLRVTLVERYATLGGVCLNVGCIPSKALLHTARVIDEAALAAEHGVRFGAPEIDLDVLRAWKDGVVAQLTRGLTDLARRREVRVVHGTGTFVSSTAIEVVAADGADPIRIPFAGAIIAVGSQPARLPMLPEDPRILDSTGALELASVPPRLLIIGGGIIGVEMATIYAALGSRVTIVEMLDRLVGEADADLVRPLAKRLATVCEEILIGARVEAAVAAEDAIVVTVIDAGGQRREVRADAVLVAVGRRPNGARIGAERAGIEVDAKGFIRVDEQLRTNVPHILAIGDVTGDPMLAHRASHQGKVAAEIVAGQKVAFDARAIPAVAYTDPEIAWVGLTEQQAAARGIEVDKGVFPWAASGRAIGMNRTEGFSKLLFDRATKRLLGAGIVGPHAGDLIAEATLAIEMGADATDIGLTVHPHPTLSETISMAAEVAEGTVVDLYLKPRRGRAG
jgi:dihydrolipoamide dehydrogenase